MSTVGTVIKCNREERFSCGRGPTALQCGLLRPHGAVRMRCVESALMLSSTTEQINSVCSSVHRPLTREVSCGHFTSPCNCSVR